MQAQAALASEPRELELVGVRVERPANNPIVLLKEKDGDRYLPIWIGPAEATAIAFAQQGKVPAWPLAHDVLGDVIKATDIQISRVVVASLTEGIFDADIYLSNGRHVRARPSDAIALALRFRSSILAAAEVLGEVGITVPAEEVVEGIEQVNEHSGSPWDLGKLSQPGDPVVRAKEQPIQPAVTESAQARASSIVSAPTITLELVGVRVEVATNKPIVLLKEKDGDSYLAIWIGQAEATAIAYAQRGVVTARPLTHDLFGDVLKAMDLRVVAVTIARLNDGVFESEIVLAGGRRFGARPSDAIALAVRAGAKILTTPGILDVAGVRPPDDGVGGVATS